MSNKITMEQLIIERNAIIAKWMAVKGERDILLRAMRTIANCDEKSCERYVAEVDSIAVDALVAIEIERGAE